MLNNLLSDLRLYRRLIGMQLRIQAQYKFNLAVDIGTYLFVTTMEFFVVFFYFGSFKSILGWKIGEIALLTATASFGFGLAEMIGAGIDSFDMTIRRGEFDRLLLRPVSAFIQVIGSDFRLRRLGRLTQGCIAFVLGLVLLPGFYWTPAKLLILLLGITSAAAIFVSILLLSATLCFWTVEATELFNSLTYGGREMMSYPITIYHQLLQRFFLFVVPLAFGAYIPVCYLLDRPLPFGLPGVVAFAAPLAALAFALVAGAIWHFGVHHYQGTGS
jgi:ABC-2 type transport system permease protein